MNNYTGLSKALNRDDIPDSLAFGTDGTGDFRDDNGLIVKAFDPETVSYTHLTLPTSDLV